MDSQKSSTRLWNTAAWGMMEHWKQTMAVTLHYDTLIPSRITIPVQKWQFQLNRINDLQCVQDVRGNNPKVKLWTQSYHSAMEKQHSSIPQFKGLIIFGILIYHETYWIVFCVFWFKGIVNIKAWPIYQFGRDWPVTDISTSSFMLSILAIWFKNLALKSWLENQMKWFIPNFQWRLLFSALLPFKSLSTSVTSHKKKMQPQCRNRSDQFLIYGKQKSNRKLVVKSNNRQSTNKRGNRLSLTF